MIAEMDQMKKIVQVVKLANSNVQPMISVSTYHGNVMEEKTAEMDQMKKIVQVQVAKPTSSDVPVHLKNSVLMWTGNVMEGKTAEMPRMKKIVQIPHPHPPH